LAKGEDQILLLPTKTEEGKKKKKKRGSDLEAEAALRIGREGEKRACRFYSQETTKRERASLVKNGMSRGKKGVRVRSVLRWRKKREKKSKGHGEGAEKARWARVDRRKRGSRHRLLLSLAGTERKRRKKKRGARPARRLPSRSRTQKEKKGKIRRGHCLHLQVEQKK